MTNKRFTIGDMALQDVYCGCIPAILDEEVPCTQKYVCKILNELNDENYQLKQIFEVIIDTAERNGVITKSELREIKKEIFE